MPKTVLVVDDNFEDLKTMSLILGKENYEVKTADNGVEAFDFLKKNKPDWFYWLFSF